MKVRPSALWRGLSHTLGSQNGRWSSSADGFVDYSDAMAAGATAETAFDFSTAGRHYLIASTVAEAGSDDEIRALMRAASCMERHQNWRSHSATWEKIGERLGGQPSHYQPGQSDMYHVISYAAWEEALIGRFSEPRAAGDESVNTRQAARRAQQRAWCYQWAAEGTEQQRRHSHARDLYRKAGIAFIASAEMPYWKSRPAVRAKLMDTAAWCFFRAAWCSWQPGNLSVPALDSLRITSPPEDRFNVSWAPDQIFKAYRGPDAHRKATDLDRMCEAYLYYGRLRGSMALAHDCVAQRLSELQALLYLTGERRQSRSVYTLRRHAERKADLAQLRNVRSEQRLLGGGGVASISGFRRRLRLGGRLVASYVGWALTGNNASVIRTSCSLLVLYCVVFPALYLNLMVPGPAFHPDATPRWVDSLILSLLTTVGLASSRFTVDSALGNLLEGVQGWSAFVALGYLIWLLTRQFDS